LKLLAAPPDRKLGTVGVCLWAIPERLRVSVSEVCIDMREGYMSAVKIVLPQARIVADWFHVASLNTVDF